MNSKAADLAGPGISTYDEVEKILPDDYESILSKKETQKAIYALRNYIEKALCEKLNLMWVECPLAVYVESGVNDMLDRDGSRTPIEFNCGLGLENQFMLLLIGVKSSPFNLQLLPRF